MKKNLIQVHSRPTMRQREMGGFLGATRPIHSTIRCANHADKKKLGKENWTMNPQPRPGIFVQGAAGGINPL